MKILLCDDDPVIRYLLTVVLGKRGGFEIVEVAKAGEVVLTALQSKPDLILLDYVMPDHSGAEVAEMIRAEAELTGIPVVFLTGRSDIAEETLERSGVSGIIEKPFDTTTLPDRLRGFVAAHR